MTRSRARQKNIELLPRRIARHFRQHDWFGVLADLTVVIVGVFLGLQVSNWNEARLAKVDEAVLIDRLVRDLKEMELEASAKARFIGENQRRIEEVIVLLESGSALPSDDMLKSAIRQLVTMPGTIERSPTVLELLAGGMRRITDDELRAAIVKHDGMLLDAKETQAIRRGYMGPYVAKLHRLRVLLDAVEPARAMELSGGSLEIRLALTRLREIYDGEGSKLQDALNTTQLLLDLLGDKKEVGDVS